MKWISSILGNYVHKNLIFFRNSADFEAHDEIDNFSIGNKTTSNLKQNPVCNGYYKISESNDVLKNDYSESPLGYDKVDLFLDEVKT